MQLNYPLRFDGRGRTAETSDDQHIRDLIEQVLFTSPGERVNRPTFGSGLLQTVFEPAGDQLVATLNLLIQSSLHQWLGDLIVVDSVEVDASEGTLTVQVVYTIRRTQQQIASTFQRLGVAA